jgi:hypothetical protein
MQLPLTMRTQNRNGSDARIIWGPSYHILKGRKYMYAYFH